VFCPVDGDHLLAGVISVRVNVAVDGGGRRWTLDEVLYLGRARTRDWGAVCVLIETETEKAKGNPCTY
jgi:hypothetical protein